MTTRAPGRSEPRTTAAPPLRRVPVTLRLALLAAVVGAMFVTVVIVLGGSFSAGRVRGWVDDSGVVAPIAFVALASGLSAIFFPGPVLNTVAGVLFGTAVGTLLALVATTLSAVISFAVGRWVAGDAIAELGGPRLRALAAAIERHGFLSVLTVRIIPGVPFPLVNYAAGLTGLSLLTYTAATAIGTAPRTFAYVALGGSFGDFDRPEAIVAVAILAAMAIGGLIMGRYALRNARR